MSVRHVSDICGMTPGKVVQSREVHGTSASPP